jgi:hypothetical protein
MKLFMTSLYSLILAPLKHLTYLIEDKKDGVINFSLLLIILVASAQYIGFSNSSGIASISSSFFYIILMLFYVSFFLLTIFIESSITSFFLKSRNVSPFTFGGKQVFTIISLSYFPYLLFPAISIISLSMGGIVYFIAMIVLFIIVIRLRKGFLERYLPYFNTSSSFSLAIIPVIIQVSLGFLLFILMGSMFGLFLVQGVTNSVSGVLTNYIN